MSAGQRVLKRCPPPPVFAVWVCLGKQKEFHDLFMSLSRRNVKSCSPVVVSKVGFDTKIDEALHLLEITGTRGRAQGKLGRRHIQLGLPAGC